MVFKSNTFYTHNYSHNQHRAESNHGQPPSSNKPAPSVDLRQSFLDLTKRLEESCQRLEESCQQLKVRSAQNHSHARHKTSQSSSAAANSNREPYVMMKRKSPLHQNDKEKKKNKAIPGTSGSVSHHHQPMQKTKVSLVDEGKKNCDTHNQTQKKEQKEGKIKTVSQSSNCFCWICFDLKPASDMFQGNKCNHPFCIDCISKHVAAKIKQNLLKVNCPNPNCNVELKPEYLQPILPREVIDRWESAKYESSIASWQKTYCPFRNCSVLLVDDENRRHDITSSECPSCHRLFCVQCKVPWHAEMNCKEFQKSKRSELEKELDGKFLKLAKSQMWQKCPKCFVYVQRYSGCEHMICRCGCNFCYLCGSNWKSGHLCNTRRYA